MVATSTARSLKKAEKGQIFECPYNYATDCRIGVPRERDEPDRIGSVESPESKHPPRKCLVWSLGAGGENFRPTCLSGQPTQPFTAAQVF